MADDTGAGFEAQLEELEAVVARLETGNLNLEETVVLFERGVVLTRACKTTLASAESRVEAVLNPEQGGPIKTRTIDVDTEEMADDGTEE